MGSLYVGPRESGGDICSQFEQSSKISEVTGIGLMEIPGGEPMTNAIKIADYLRATKQVYGETQLQKLLYYSQAWSLVWTGKPMFTDEIEAWANGPVVRQVWSAGRRSDYVVPSDGGALGDEQRAVVDAVFAFYGRDCGARLSERTHAEQPWLEARRGVPDGASSTNVIAQSTIRRFFTQLSLAGGELPVAPVRSASADDDAVRAAAERQSARWRGALDELAQQ